MIVAGVHLDNAWTDLSAQFGAALRDWSRDVLAYVVTEANRRDVETLLIAGDLFNRSFALPATIDLAAQLLATFRGNVLIAPGRTDWIDATSLYSTHKWAANTFIWSASEYQPSELVPLVWASAWTSPARFAPRIPDAPGPRLLVRAGMSDADLDRVAIGPDDLVVTTGVTGADTILSVPDLVHDPREAGGFALLVDGEKPTSAVQRVELPGPPGTLVEQDVTDIPDTDAFATALEWALTSQGPLVLRLIGTLGPAVLLPGFGGPALPPGVVLDLDSLTFGALTVDATDRSARAEFIRAMAETKTIDLQRHQTTALGLAALGSDVKEG
ncbi:hypothetical protein [Mycobacterium asiaticum]|uniref:hypothetical protein n=1 Tax=Mycobacterium asiaticum TaxID=1790 RepID=UPI000A7E985F|nr:hypothetical protein [Mycobacterium asiaticum]